MSTNGSQTQPRVTRAPLSGGALEVGEDPRVVRRQLAVDPLVVERLEQTLGGLAQRRRFPNEYGDRLAPAALTHAALVPSGFAGVGRPAPGAGTGC